MRSGRHGSLKQCLPGFLVDVHGCIKCFGAIEYACAMNSKSTDVWFVLQKETHPTAWYDAKADNPDDTVPFESDRTKTHGGDY